MYTSLSGAATAARNLEEPGTNPRSPQTPAAEGPLGLPQPPWLDPAAIQKWRVPMGKPQFENLPSGLTSNPFWLFCVWRYKERPGSKPAKIPYNVKTGLPAKVSDVSTFGSFDEAVSAYNAGGYDGIGVLLTGSLAALDLDNCIDDDGQLSPMAADIIARMNAYVEISPSCRGLRILFRVSADFNFDSSRYYINNHELGVEAYLASATAKYVTLTGWALTQGKELEERDKELTEVLELYMVRSQPQATALATVAPLALTDVQLTAADYQLIATVQQSLSGNKFTALGCGDMSAYDNNHSSCDLAFCNTLAAYTDDPEQIDRIFRASKLMRPKWDEPRGDSTYGWITIQKAIAGAQSYRERLRAEQMEQAAAQTGTLAPAPAAIVSAETVPTLEAGQEPAQALDLAAVQAAVCVPVEAAPQPQQMQVITKGQILAHQKQQRQAELMNMYPSLSAQELYDANLPPILFLVEKIFSSGLGLLVGMSKFGKSFLAFYMALRLAAGKSFLGYKTTQCGVLYLALEDNWSRLQGRMKPMLRGQRPPDGLYIMIQSPNMENGLFELIEAQLALHPEIKLVIADTFQKIRGGAKGKEGAYSADYRELGCWKDLCAAHDISALLVHHTNKREDTDDLYNKISGTTGIMAAADTIWVAEKTRGEDKGVLNITGRDVEDTELIVYFDKSTFTWESCGSADELAEEEARKEYEDSPVVQAIQSLVDNDAGAWKGTATEIKNHMPAAAASVYTAQQVTREILHFEDRLYQYDCIVHSIPTTRSTGGKKHHFYVNPNAEGAFVPYPPSIQEDTESDELVRAPFSDEDTGTSTDTQPAE